jgi:DNA end-binding protein Ku
MQTIWKGAISFGLVNVPVKMYTATQDNDIPMKMLHKEYNVPIHYSRTCPKCDKEVSWGDIVKGYEYEPGHYVTFDKEELEKIGSEKSREIRILDFVQLEEIDPIYYQKTYYLAPEENGSHAYRLLAKALEATKKIGIANITLRTKSSLAAIRVVDGVLSVVTMFYAEEIRPKQEIPSLPKDGKVDERELDMAKMLIEQLTSTFKPEQYEDAYRERLLEAIDDKVEGKEVHFAPEEKPTNVVNLMDALQASLKQMKGVQRSDKGAVKTGSKDEKAEPAKSKAKSKPKTAPRKQTKKTGA